MTDHVADVPVPTVLQVVITISDLAGRCASRAVDRQWLDGYGPVTCADFIHRTLCELQGELTQRAHREAQQQIKAVSGG